MMTRKIIYTALALWLINLTAYSQSHSKKNSQFVTQTVQVSNFKGITILGSADVLYKQTPGKQQVEIYASKNIINDVEVKEINGILTIQTKNKMHWFKNSRLEVRVCNPEINFITINGSGDIRLLNGLKTTQDLMMRIKGSGDLYAKRLISNKLDLSINGSGDMNLANIKAHTVLANIFGSGDITLTGEAYDVGLYSHGSGDIDATRLKGQRVTSQINGSGDIDCYAVQHLNMRVNGSGDLNYKGHPKEVISNKRKR